MAVFVNTGLTLKIGQISRPKIGARIAQVDLWSPPIIFNPYFSGLLKNKISDNKSENSRCPRWVTVTENDSFVKFRQTNKALMSLRNIFRPDMAIHFRTGRIIHHRTQIPFNRSNERSRSTNGVGKVRMISDVLLLI